MNTRFNVVLAGVLVLCGSALAQAPPQPTMDDLRKMYQAKEYKLCLQQIARVMRAAQNPASGWDKYALMLMRGDCLLGLSDGASAKEIRDWARANGFEVPDRGRVSADVRAAYDKAH